MITPSFGLTATERVLPKLALDFTTASLDSRITFTRTTGASNPATYVNSGGIVTAATNNQPRFDYDPVTLVCKGLLVEESRANLLSYSDAFDNAAWTKSNLSVSADAITSPDGTTNADKIVPNTTNTSHPIYRTVTVTSGVAHALTVYVKAGGYNYVGIRATSPFAFFNLTNGTVDQIQAGITSASIVDVGNGWFRCTVIYTPSTTSLVYHVYPCSAASTNSFAGDGTSGIYIWGAQLEAGAFATSYIPTTTTALTRNADVATMTGTNFSSWFNASTSTAEAEFTILYGNKGIKTSGVFSFYQDGTHFAESYISTTPKSVFLLYDAATQANLQSATLTLSGIQKVCCSFALNNSASATNGVFDGTDAACTIPSVSSLKLGVTDNAGQILNGHLRKFNYWPQRMTNNEVIAFSK